MMPQMYRNRETRVHTKMHLVSAAHSEVKRPQLEQTLNNHTYTQTGKTHSSVHVCVLPVVSPLGLAALSLQSISTPSDSRITVMTSDRRTYSGTPVEVGQ